MRSNLTRGIGLGALLLSMTSGCDPAPVNDSRFWTGRADAGSSTVTTGSGGSSESGGSGVVTGSGGDNSSGGSPGSGGAPAAGGAGDSGGGPGSGGAVGSGGRTGSGGGTASGGSFGSGGGTASGGSQGTGGRVATGGTNGSGGAANTGGAVGSGGGSALTGTLNVSVTTKAAGGEFAPDNVGAIWIADSSTKFVKSLYVWGSQRRKELSTWTSATSAAGLANNLVDAVTAATMRSHGVRTATWNGTNASKAAVPDGAYKVCFELRDGSGGSQCVDFMKSRTAQTVSPADTTIFTKRTIGYTP